MAKHKQTDFFPAPGKVERKKTRTAPEHPTRDVAGNWVDHATAIVDHFIATMRDADRWQSGFAINKFWAPWKRSAKAVDPAKIHEVIAALKNMPAYLDSLPDKSRQWADGRKNPAALLNRLIADYKEVAAAGARPRDSSWGTL